MVSRANSEPDFLLDLPLDRGDDDSKRHEIGASSVPRSATVCVEKSSASVRNGSSGCPDM